MKQNGHSMFLNGLRRVAIVIVASGAVAAPAVYANASNIDLVPQKTLPESAGQTGEAIKRPPVKTPWDPWKRDYELGLAGAG
jgi:hypothetical protein